MSGTPSRNRNSIAVPINDGLLLRRGRWGGGGGYLILGLNVDDENNVAVDIDGGANQRRNFDLESEGY